MPFSARSLGCISLAKRRRNDARGTSERLHAVKRLIDDVLQAGNGVGRAQLRFNATVTDASSAAAQRRRSITSFHARWEVPFTPWVICNRCASSATSGKLHGRQARFGDTCGESRSDERFRVARRNKGSARPDRRGQTRDHRPASAFGGAILLKQMPMSAITASVAAGFGS